MRRFVLNAILALIANFAATNLVAADIIDMGHFTLEDVDPQYVKILGNDDIVLNDGGAETKGPAISPSAHGPRLPRTRCRP